MAAAVLAALTAACGRPAAPGVPEDAFPVVANADLTVGSQRLLVGLATADGASLAAADFPVEFDLYSPEAVEPSFTVTGIFLWTVPDVRGLYRTEATFDRAGRWRIAAHSPGGPSGLVIPFDVAEEGLTPEVGDLAPAVRTQTSGEVEDLSEISTDPNPDPAFYERSLDAALISGRPTVAVFSTPGLCQTATCGPMLDNVKRLAVDFPDVNFVHIEIYENLDAATPGELRVAEAVEAWRLISEPWVFVVDSTGIIVARFEGAVDPEELRAVLEKLR